MLFYTLRVFQAWWWWCQPVMTSYTAGEHWTASHQHHSTRESTPSIGTVQSSSSNNSLNIIFSKVSTRTLWKYSRCSSKRRRVSRVVVSEVAEYSTSSNSHTSTLPAQVPSTIQHQQRPQQQNYYPQQWWWCNNGTIYSNRCNITLAHHTNNNTNTNDNYTDCSCCTATTTNNNIQHLGGTKNIPQQYITTPHNRQHKQQQAMLTILRMIMIMIMTKNLPLWWWLL